MDTEVQNILREIRERVRAGAPAGEASPQLELVQPASAPFEMRESSSKLAQAASHLATVERARDQLPPLTSKRSGLLARLELWFKRQARRATRWYAWEQVNFNEAVSHALGDLVDAFAAYERETAKLHEQTSSLQQLKPQLDSRFARLEARLALLEERASGDQMGDASLSEIRAEIEGLRRLLDERISQARQEQCHRIAELRDEQRVSFKQLALEIRETQSRRRE
jgi:hypothetical protein